MTSALQFAVPQISATWAASRETHLAVATAIHAVSSDSRTPEMIWEDPTQNEFQNVEMAVQNYIEAGEFPAEDDGRYAWGEESIIIAAEA